MFAILLAASSTAHTTLIYHKPCGLVTTHNDELGRRTVYDALQDLLPNAEKEKKWHACGRLDQSTSGLLVMTTDGRLVRHVTDPTAGAAILKRYRAKCHLLREGAIEELQSGVDLGGGLGCSSPAVITVEAQERKSHTLSISIREGKNRQIRRMLHAVGSGVMELERQAVGGLELGQLPEGEFRWLSAEEVEEALGYPPAQGTASAAAVSPITSAVARSSSSSSSGSSSSGSRSSGSGSSTNAAASDGGSYALLDCGGLRRLERFNGRTVSRPCPAATWSIGLHSDVWAAAELAYVEAVQAGGQQASGRWEGDTSAWSLSTDSGFSLGLQAGPSGQLGAFPEQAMQWRWLKAVCEAGDARRGRPLRVLNLFAHTGGSTLACAAGGAEVTHVDGARSAVGRARENAGASGLEGAAVRWIADDVLTYVARAARRGERFDGVVLDPPAFGRGGKKGEWRIQRDLPKLAALLAEVMEEEAAFVLLTCHDARWPADKLSGVLSDVLDGGGRRRRRGKGSGGSGGSGGGTVDESGSMVLRAEEGAGKDLPMGCYARWATG